MPAADTFAASADSYDRLVGRYAAPLASALIDFAGIQRRMRVLDVGCGPGGLTAALVDRVGAAKVSAAEPSEPFVAAVRARLPGVDVAVAHAESLPFADDAFDATLSQLVVNFMRDPDAGVREMRRVTRPGGLLASCVWDYAGEMTLLNAFWGAAVEVDAGRAAAVDERVVMPWCREGELAELWRAGGMLDVRFAPLLVRATYVDFEDLWTPFLAGVAPSGAFCASLEQERRVELRDRLRRRIGVGEGPFELTARAWAVVGVVPR